jgi:hypothetical protein
VVATVDGEPDRDRETDLRPYWFGVFAFAEAVVVSHLAWGRPRLQSLQRNLGTIGTMRELERAGRLAVTVGEDGTVNIGVADDETESTYGAVVMHEKRQLRLGGRAIARASA